MSKRSANSYGVAIAAVTVAVLVRWLLDPWLGDDQPLVTLFGAVAVAEWFSGPYPTVVGAILGYLVCDWLFQAPRGAIGVENLQKFLDSSVGKVHSDYSYNHSNRAWGLGLR